MTDGRLSNEELAMSDTLSDKYADLPLDQLSKRLRDKASFCESADGGWRDVTAALLREADRRLSTLQRSADQMREALEPFSTFAKFAVNDHGWIDGYGREQISTWFGPSDFRVALTASNPKKGNDCE